MDKDKIIKMATEISQRMLDEGSSILPICIIEKEKEVNIIGFPFRNNEEKEIYRNLLFSMILNEKVVSYTLIMDTKMTIADTILKNPYSKAKIKDVILINIYTPKDKQMVGLEYVNKKIKAKPLVDVSGRIEGSADLWDLWGNQEMNDKINKDYQRFKKDNPDKYRGV